MKPTVSSPVKEFLHRGLIFGGLGPIVIGIVYFILHRMPCITKYDWDGNFVEYIPLDRKSDEPENIMFLGDKIYLGFNVWNKDHKIAAPELVEVVLKKK